MVKNTPANGGRQVDLRDVGLILGSGRSPGGGNGNTLQYFCLGNPMDRGSWQAIVHGVTESNMTEHGLAQHAYGIHCGDFRGMHLSLNT